MTVSLAVALACAGAAAGVAAAVAWMLARALSRAASAQAHEELRSAEEQRDRLEQERARADEARSSAAAQVLLEQRERSDAEARCAVTSALLAQAERRSAELRDELALSVRAAADALGRLAEEQRLRSASEAELRSERASGADKLATLHAQEQQLAERFAALSAEALQRNNQSFMELAKTQLEAAQQSVKTDIEKRQTAFGELVLPMREKLDKFEEGLHRLELKRQSAYDALHTQVGLLNQSQDKLKTETANLVKALRAPAVRGRWAEIHLRRVVEMAGLVEHCDFEEQTTITSEEGTLRPDMRVRMPGGLSVVVDAKAPLQAYLDAIETDDESVRRIKLADHARQVQKHVADLSRKAYWEQFERAPEFVILFMPNDAAFNAAQEQEPTLVEAALKERIVFATPMTLIAMLRTISYVWRQESITRNAQEISELGRELHERIAKTAEHLARLGQKLQGSVQAYNEAIGSLERRVLPAARRFKELKVAGGSTEVEPLLPIDLSPRVLQAPEMLQPAVPEDAN